jgi:phage repressor protein C with HTH and peptisase S24 domain
MTNRISARRRQLGLSQARLAELMGVEQPTVARWERERRGVKIDTLVRLAKALDCDPRDLMGDDASPPTEGPRGAVPVALPGGRDLPVCGGARGGSDAMFLDQGTPIDWVQRPPQLVGVPDAFAVYVVNDSMSPRYEPGDILFMHPTQPPSRGSFVVVELSDQEAYVKQLVSQTAEALVLREFQPAPREFSVPRSRVKALYRVVGSWEGR